MSPSGDPGARRSVRSCQWAVPTIVPFLPLPDFLGEMADGNKRLVEVKPSQRLDRPIVQRKLAVGRLFAAQEGWSFHVVTEKELFQGPLLDNVRLLNRYRQGRMDPGVLDLLVPQVPSSGIGISGERRWHALEPLTKLLGLPVESDYTLRSEDLQREGITCSARTLRRYFRAWHRAGKHRLTLRCFTWRIAPGRKEFCGMLKRLDESLPLAEVSGLAESELAGRFYLACRGVPDYLMALVRGALGDAVVGGRVAFLAVGR